MKVANVNSCSTGLVQRSGARLLILILLLGVAIATRGQEWETIFTLPPPAEAERPTLFIPSFPTPTAQLWIGINKPDRNLAILDLETRKFSVKDSFGQGVHQFGYDPASRSIYALSSDGVWTVRRSQDNGVSWTVVDSLPGGDFSLGYGPRSFARDSAGNLYVSGSYPPLFVNGPATWLVRKSSDGGSTWTTVYELPNASGGKIIFVPGLSSLFSAGRSGSAGWTVRRSLDGGVTWHIVDTFVRPGKTTSVESIISDRSGRIYAAGFSEPDPSRWEVRMSEDGGYSWNTISPPFNAQHFATRAGMAVDAEGTLFVAGSHDGWAVARRTSDGVWLDPEHPFGTVGTGPFLRGTAWSITIDRNGNVFVGGIITLGGDLAGTLVVQKLAATVPPSLGMQRLDKSVTLSWPAAAAGNRLETSTAMGAGASWTPIVTAPVVIGDEQVVTVPIGDGAQFFRLSKP